MTLNEHVKTLSAFHGWTERRVYATAQRRREQHVILLVDGASDIGAANSTSIVSKVAA